MSPLHPRVVLRAALLALVVVAGACSSSTGGTAGPATTGTEADVTATTGPPAAAGTRPWWIVGGAVTPGAVRADGPDPVRSALDALVAGPTPEEQAFGATTAIEKGVVVNSMVLGPDGVVTVDFNRKFETRDTRPQVAQVVYTLTQFPQVAKVRFLVDGQPNGATGVPPVGRQDLRFPSS